MAQPTWNTTAGSIGSYPALLPMTITLSASAVTPATTITYTLLSGSLPNGLSLTTSGVISGTPSLVTTDTTTTFAVRATDNLSNIRDRTFSITVSGSAIPQFTTPNGAVASAGWFWDNNKLNQYCDKDDFITLTKRINGGTIGLEDRKHHYEIAMHYLTS